MPKRSILYKKRPRGLCLNANHDQIREQNTHAIIPHLTGCLPYLYILDCFQDFPHRSFKQSHLRYKGVHSVVKTTLHAESELEAGRLQMQIKRDTVQA